VASLFRCRVLVAGLACHLLAAGAGCSSDEPKGRASPKAGELVKIFDPGKDGAVNGVAIRGDGTLFVSTSRGVRAIPRKGKHEIVMDDAIGRLVTGKDAIYALGVRDGVVYEFGPGGQRQLALTAAAETAGPADPGLDDPYSMAWDAKSETLLVADKHKVDRVDPRSRRIETLSGARGDETNRADGVPARDARYVVIDDIAVDPTDGSVYLSQVGTLYRIDPSSGLVAYTHTKTPGSHRGFVFDTRTGDLFFGAEDLQGNGRIYRLARNGTLEIILKYLDEASVRALAIDPTDGALYIATRDAVFVCAAPGSDQCPSLE
jgi:hypothetical protein